MVADHQGRWHKGGVTSQPTPVPLAHQHANPPQPLALLRARRHRRNRRAAEEGDEVAPSKANAHLVLPCREAQWIAPYEVFPRALGVDRSSGREVVGTACSLIMSDSSVIMVLPHLSLQ